MKNHLNLNIFINYTDLKSLAYKQPARFTFSTQGRSQASYVGNEIADQLAKQAIRDALTTNKLVTPAPHQNTVTQTNAKMHR